MTFAIDTGATELPFAKSAVVDDTQVIRFTDYARADRAKRQVIEALQSTETPEDADAFIASESLVIDALFLAYPDMAEEISEAHQDHRALVNPVTRDPRPAEPGRAGAPAPITVIAQSPKSKGSKMFTIDTGSDGGSLGPWFTWTSEGSARKGLAPESWVLRYKAEGETEWRNDAIAAFTKGCVMDLDSLKLGWEKDGGKGVAPERRWNPSISQSTPRPSEDKKPGGGFVWGKALSVRCAIGDGKAATWEQASFGAYEAFSSLAKQIEAQYPGDGTLPLVMQTGVDRRTLPNGSTSIPILSIVKWVPRPDCLKAEAPKIATETAPAPAPKPAPAPAAAPPAASVEIPAEASF